MFPKEYSHSSLTAIAEQRTAPHLGHDGLPVAVQSSRVQSIILSNIITESEHIVVIATSRSNPFRPPTGSERCDVERALRARVQRNAPFPVDAVLPEHRMLPALQVHVYSRGGEVIPPVQQLSRRC